MLDLAKQHIIYHHGQSNGWITLAKKENGEFKQRHFKLSELDDHLPEWLGDDTFFSQNTFYAPRRRIEYLRQLRSLYIDIDCYTLGYKPDWILRKLELEMFREEIPEPNLVIFSGRGLVLIWKIEPVPYHVLPLWQAIQNFLFHKLEHLGADPKSLDAARIFRIAGSTNSKNGQSVSVNYRHNYQYTLREIQEDYLPVLRASPVHENKPRSKKSNVIHLFNIHTLHHTRLLDLNTLLKLRNNDVVGYREQICFLYRYWSSCFLGDSDEALRQTLELNREFNKPLPDREVKKATQSAAKAWENKQYEHKHNARYKLAGYNFTNEKLIQLLDISEFEQRHMKTIISQEEKYRRNNQSREKKRRQNGIPTRDEYLSTQNAITEDRLKRLQQELEHDPEASNIDLARSLEVSESYIRKLKNNLLDRTGIAL